MLGAGHCPTRFRLRTRLRTLTDGVSGFPDSFYRPACRGRQEFQLRTGQRKYLRVFLLANLGYLPIPSLLPPSERRAFLAEGYQLIPKATPMSGGVVRIGLDGLGVMGVPNLLYPS